MMYAVLYFTNLLFAVAIMANVYYLSVNEVKLSRRWLLGFLFMGCVVEVTILFFYVPMSPPTYWTGEIEQSNVALMIGKLVLKPAMLLIAFYNVQVQRQKIREGAPFGQRAALLPQSKETVEKNMEAATLSKAKEAVNTAAELVHDEEVARKLADSGLIDPMKRKQP
jgi:hypothetical protein